MMRRDEFRAGFRCAVGVMAMAGVLASGLCGCVQTSRYPQQEPTYAPVETRPIGEMAGRPTLEFPMSVPGVRVMLVPFTLEERKGWWDREDAFGGQNSLGMNRSLSDRASSGRDERTEWVSWWRSVRWHNVILIPSDGGEQRALLETRGVISRVWAFGRAVPPGAAGGPPASMLLFLVTDKDTDGDGVLTSQDAARVLATDALGRNQRWITPEMTLVLGHQHEWNADVLYLMVRADTDGDKRFTAMDQAVPYRFLPEMTAAVPVVDAKVVEQVTGIVK
jgi:hypothetical protein